MNRFGKYAVVIKWIWCISLAIFGFMSSVYAALSCERFWAWFTIFLFLVLFLVSLFKKFNWILLLSAIVVCVYTYFGFVDKNSIGNGVIWIVSLVVLLIICGLRYYSIARNDKCY